MTWVRLDEDWADNVKVVSVSKDARLLYIVALCYCAGQENDGRFPARYLPVLGAKAECEDLAGCVGELIEVGLWEEAGEGFVQVHDFTEKNPSKERLAELRAQRAEAGRKGGRARWAEANAIADGKQVPEPEPEQTADNGSSKTMARNGTKRNEDDHGDGDVYEDADADETRAGGVGVGQDGDAAGLIAELAGEPRLVRGAAGLVRKYGCERVRAVMRYLDWLQSRGEVESYHGLFVWTLETGEPVPDPGGDNWRAPPATLKESWERALGRPLGREEAVAEGVRDG